MKQKVVIKLAIHDERSRAKAMKTAVGVDGVNSATLQLDKDLIEVTGDDVDVVRLTNQLRKSLKYADVVSVNPVGEKKEEKKKEPAETITVQYAMGQPQYCYAAYPPYPDSPSICSIL